jgi:3-oxoacyl-[acyl-carrier protein] reductase
MDLGLVGRAALVTGGSSGLGKAAAMALAREGAKVAINSRSRVNLEVAATDIQKATGHTPVVIEGDLSVDGIPEKVVVQAAGKMGKINILIVNAGGPPPGPFLNHSNEVWHRSADLTLFSAIALSRAVIPDMIMAGWGRIIFITSVAVKQPIDNLIISNALRAGVTGFAKSISNELAKFGITVNTVCPGYTDTERLKSLAQSESAATGKSIDDVYKKWFDLIPAGRVGRPEELADMIAFLVSERAAFITGTSIPVDGGLYKGLL